MTLLKRILTSIVLFIVLFVFVYFAICIVGGAVSGGISGRDSQDMQDAFQAGQQAGANFVRHNIGAILLSTFGISFVSALVLSFSGIFPWCRKPSQPLEAGAASPPKISG